jgi:nicotinate-nucleotide adenylyltransferase
MIIGDDLLDGFSSWRGHESLIAMVDILVAHRLSVKELDFSFPHRYVDNLLLPISSSDIRRRVASGRVYRHIVPEPVYKYIERYMLYRRRVEF